MEEQKQTIWHRNLNLIFVYVVIFLAGIATVSIMLNIINNKVNEINNDIYTTTEYNNDI